MTKKDSLKITVEDIITTSKNGGCYLGSELMTDAEMEALRAEAHMFQSTRLWNVLTTTLRDQAKKTMFEKSTCWDDMVYGKAMLYAIGVQENIIKILTKDSIAKKKVL